MTATESTSFDVVILGGGVIGSAIAFFLAEQEAFDGTVAVVEKDPSYADSSTARSVGGIRQQFSSPENIEISKFGAEFFRSVPQRLVVDGDRPDLSFQEEGYLFLATEAGLPVLKENHAVQLAHGTDVALLTPAELAERFPWLQISDLAGGSLGLSGEGWIDPYSLLMAFKHKAAALGVEYLRGEVVDLDRQGLRITAADLGDGQRIAAGIFVDAAGPKAAAVARMAGIDDLPVASRKRLVFTFHCREALIDCPLVVDPSGLYFRPEGGKFVCGISPSAHEDPDCDDFRVDHRLFEEVLWPQLAHRVPVFDAVKQGTAWAGHYAVNVRDKNAILGPHPEVGNFYFANGFSGHGLQQAPAVGRALSELIAFGVYRTLDLSRFGFERLAAGRLIEERNVI